ncbi:MAG: RNA methyltransferase [Oligoflexales bacterium]|nr:RNA methyltransferase [Oligoflexales bacterium]
MIYESISSPQNEKIKSIVRLRENSRERRKQRLFVVEGLREINIALNNGYLIEEFYFQHESVFLDYKSKLAKQCKCYLVHENLSKKIAVREDTFAGIAVFAEKEAINLSTLKLLSEDCTLILEGVEKPGNIGAVFRTANALGIQRIILLKDHFDFYNPNTIRSSLGAVFSTPHLSCTIDELRAFKSQNNLQLFATFLSKKSQALNKISFPAQVLVAFGSEAQGLSPEIEALADQFIIIPQLGEVDSLNIANSAAIIMWELRRNNLDRDQFKTNLS